jgi:hypothetical protein
MLKPKLLDPVTVFTLCIIGIILIWANGTRIPDQAHYCAQGGDFAWVQYCMGSDWSKIP